MHSLHKGFIAFNLKNRHHASPNPIASTSIGNEPRRLVSKTSESERFDNVQSFLNLYHAEVPLPLLLDVDSIDSLTIGVKISIAPLDERRLRIFLLLLRRFPLTLPHMMPSDGGIDPRRCCVCCTGNWVCDCCCDDVDVVIDITG